MSLFERLEFKESFFSDQNVRFTQPILSIVFLQISKDNIIKKQKLFLSRSSIHLQI